MSMFISQVTLSKEGLQGLKGVPERIEENRKLWEDAGGRLVSWYVVLGDYDYLLVTEAANEKVMAEIVAKASGRGRTQFKTNVAIPINEFAEVAGNL